ncbi:hypothetical protein GCM10011611_28440 [Aliidongia dinghuensis]|uniref:Cytochrome c domain-containing protein n=1 Tax=Aliidongia dinghuensis TaxID=1867774 RepID=A0A8J2YU24_9PROT|nr:cytochrome c [Aliidongia dinghuensis]GGF20688.1 hypothetical protein GCM10011611_28440 [Aliidongia dinghuensis]
MSNKILPVALLLGAILSSAAWAQSALTLKSVSVDLPAGDGQFAGDGADAINNNCTACHSPGMVLNQPNMSKTAWEGEVHKMINIFEAPVDDKDVAPIVAYLTKNKGAN